MEADRASWTPEDLSPYVDVLLSTFGPSRLIFGGDWPVLLLASSLPRWIDALDGLLSALTDGERRMIFRDNANAFYRLGL